MEAQTLASAEAIRDPFTSPGVLGEAVKTDLADAKFIPGVTDFPTAASLAPDNRVERALEQGPPVISYLSHGMTADDVGARPDDRADRFAHGRADAARGSAAARRSKWNDALTVGIGALVLALGLGLALGVLRRPRLAGLGRLRQRRKAGSSGPAACTRRVPPRASGGCSKAAARSASAPSSRTSS